MKTFLVIASSFLFSTPLILLLRYRSSISFSKEGSLARARKLFNSPNFVRASARSCKELPVSDLPANPMRATLSSAIQRSFGNSSSSPMISSRKVTASGMKGGSPHFLTPELRTSKSAENKRKRNFEEFTRERSFLPGLMSSRSNKSGFACFPSTRKGSPERGSRSGANSLKSSSMTVSSLTTMRTSPFSSGQLYTLPCLYSSKNFSNLRSPDFAKSVIACALSSSSSSASTLRDETESSDPITACPWETTGWMAPIMRAMMDKTERNLFKEDTLRSKEGGLGRGYPDQARQIYRELSPKT